MSSRATVSVLTPTEILIALREQVPELEGEQRWPASIVFDAFADHVADRMHRSAQGYSMTTAQPGAIHARLLERFPALGELCFDEVLTELSQLAWEAHVGGRPDLARRSMGFAEWLAEQGREDLAERAVSPLFDAVTGAVAGAGPRTADLLRHR